MKTIIINKDIIDKGLLKEGLLLDKLPDDIISALRSNDTSLGNNPSFPDIYDDNFTEIIANKRFEDIKSRLKSIGKIVDVKSKNINDLMSELIIRCKREEEASREQLEKLCCKYVMEIFGIPEDTVEFECKLVNDVKLDSNSFQIQRIKGDYEYDDIESAENMLQEVYKRKIINALAMGSAMNISSQIKEFSADLYDINPRLPILYRDILLINEYLSFTKNRIDMNDKNPKQIGCVLLTLGNKEKKSKIVAQGVVFPILLCETIRGFMELFSSHGLPDDLNVAQEIIKRSDYIKAEPWYMRLGPEMWNMITDGKVKTNIIPYFFKRICMLDIENFNNYMKNVFANTKRGKEMTDILIRKAEEDIGNLSDDDNVEIMKEPNTDKNVISDEYIREEEL